VGDSKKQADNNHVDDIMDSDELFDLDMPLDEPNESQADAMSDMLEQPEQDIQPIISEESESPGISDSFQDDSFQDLIGDLPEHHQQNDETNDPETEHETLQSVEQDIEELLDRSGPNDEEALEKFPLPHTETSMEDMDPPMPAVTEPAADTPVLESEKATPRARIASSVILTLGLIAILIITLAGWLGLDASQQKAQLASVSSNLQQQIQLLEQQQKQQKILLTKHIEALEKRVNTLTQVIANKTAEQWRTAQQHTAADLKKTAATETAGLQSKQTIATATPKPAIKPVRHAAINPATTTQTAAKAKQQGITPASKKIKTIAEIKPVTHAVTTTTPLSMYEVAPGTVKGWVVNIYSVTSRSTAEKRIRQLKAKDIDAKYVRVQIKGKTWYRVRASGFKDKQAAATFKQFLKDYHGIDAWYSYLK